MKNFDLFVGVTVIPLWNAPTQSADEVKTRAELKEAFLKISGEFAEQLKRIIQMQGQQVP